MTYHHDMHNFYPIDHRHFKHERKSLHMNVSFIRLHVKKIN